MTSKKILIFSTAYFPFVGGAELAVKEITDRISNIQFDIITLRFDKKWPTFERIGNINVYRISGPKLFFPFTAFFKALTLYKKNKYCLIWAVMANRAGFAALFFKFFHPEIKFLLTLQEGDPFTHPRKRAGILWIFVKFLFRAVFTKADYIQVISRYLADWARSMGAKCPIEVVPNGVDMANFSKDYSEKEIQGLKNKLDIRENEKIIITTSRLVGKNAIDDLIKALAEPQTENYRLLILGVGPDLEKLQNLSRELGVQKKIMFLDHITHDELPKYLKISDIFVRPSLSEGLGSSFLEAMAAGIPVIATPVGGIPDFLRDKEIGLFCEVRNPKSIAEKVRILLKNNELREKIIKNAEEMVAKNYGWDLISQKMQNIFNKSLS